MRAALRHGAASMASGSISAASALAAPALAQAMAARPPPQAKSSTRRPCSLAGVVEDVAGEGLAAGPGEGPERRGKPRPGASQCFGRLPDGGDLGRKVERDLGDQGGAGRWRCGRQRTPSEESSLRGMAKRGDENGGADQQPGLPVGVEAALAAGRVVHDIQASPPARRAGRPPGCRNDEDRTGQGSPAIIPASCEQHELRSGVAGGRGTAGSCRQTGGRCCGPR